MAYLTEQEQENMIREFHEFDENLIHERYRESVERALRLKSTDLTRWKCTVCLAGKEAFKEIR